MSEQSAAEPPSPTGANTGGTEGTESGGTISKGRASGIVLASIAAAVSTFAITIVAARTLDPVGNAEFLVFWSVTFAVIGLITGMQNEATRAVSLTRQADAIEGSGGTAKGAPILQGGLVIGFLVAVLVAVSAFWWGELLVPTTSPLIVLVIAASAISYAAHTNIAGALAGLKIWGPFAGMLGGEAILRLALVLAAGLALGGLWPLEIAVAIPFALWIVFVLASPGARQAARARADVGLPQLLRNNTMALVTSASAAALLTGFPALLRLTSPDAPAALLAGTILAISLTRSPIMIPLQAFQGVAVTAFTEARGNRLKALVKPLGLLGGIGLIGAVLAALLGPWLLALIWGPAYQITWWTFGGLMLAAVAIAWLTLTGTATIALSAHRAYAGGWALAAIVSLGLLFLPLSVEIRSIVALIVGPMLGVITHLIAIAAIDRRLLTQPTP